MYYSLCFIVMVHFKVVVNDVLSYILFFFSGPAGVARICVSWLWEQLLIKEFILEKYQLSNVTTHEPVIIIKIKDILKW